MNPQLAQALDLSTALADLRGRVEYVIWRAFPAATAEQVDFVMSAADAYALSLAYDRMLQKVLPAVRLAEATAECYRRKP